MNDKTFDLTIERQGTGYTIRAELAGSSVIGPTPFVLPFDLAMLAQQRADVANWVRQAAVPRRGSSEELLRANELGAALFERVFVDDIGITFRSSRDGLAPGERLRLCLRLPPELEAVPWELLYDSERRTRLALDPRIGLLRRPALNVPVPPLRLDGPIKVVAVAANPDDPKLHEIKVEQELRRLEDALRELRDQGHVHLDLVRGRSTLDKLRRRLQHPQQNPVHVLHILCHGGIDEDEGVLLFEDADGHSEPVPASYLQSLFAWQQGLLRLVVLNACQGAVSSESDPLGSVAAALLRVGVPAVVAMQFDMPDDAARELTRVFYDRVVEGIPVDLALAEARQHLFQTFRGRLDWAVPVLFLRVDDGRLFDVSLSRQKHTWPRWPSLNTRRKPAFIARLWLVMAVLLTVFVAVSLIYNEGPVPLPDQNNQETLYIGYSQAPDTLYGFASEKLVTSNVLQFIQPGCVVVRHFEYEPVCFDRLPTLENGDLLSETVLVQPQQVTPETPVVVDGVVITSSLAITQPLHLVQLTAKFYIKEGITWDDGVPMTADDFVYTYKLARDPDTPLQKSLRLIRTKAVIKIDDHTFFWQGLPGNLDPLYMLNFSWDDNLSVYPAHILRDILAKDVASNWNMHPIGYGPFKYESFLKDKTLTLQRNEYYWRKNEGYPRVKRIVFKFVSEDQLLEQLQNGGIDIAGTIGLNPDDIDILHASGIRIDNVPSTLWEHIDFAIQRDDNIESFFEDVRVRKAIAYSIDRQDIINSMFNGQTKVMHTYQPFDYWVHPPISDLELYLYNPSKAEQLLEEAGWHIGTDGKTREKNGRRFKVDFYTTKESNPRRNIAEKIQSQLSKVGIDVQLHFVSSDDLFALGINNGILSRRRFDMAMYSWISGPEPSIELYLCEQIPKNENGYTGKNSTGYCNPEYDRIAKQSLNYLEKSERIQPIMETMKIFNRDLPALPLYQRVKIVAWREGITAIKLDESAIVDFQYPEDLGYEAADPPKPSKKCGFPPCPI